MPEGANDPEPVKRPHGPAARIELKSAAANGPAKRASMASKGTPAIVLAPQLCRSADDHVSSGAGSGDVRARDRRIDRRELRDGDAGQFDRVRLPQSNILRRQPKRARSGRTVHIERGKQRAAPWRAHRNRTECRRAGPIDRVEPVQLIGMRERNNVSARIDGEIRTADEGFRRHRLIRNQCADVRHARRRADGVEQEGAAHFGPQFQIAVNPDSDSAVVRMKRNHRQIAAVERDGAVRIVQWNALVIKACAAKADQQQRPRHRTLDQCRQAHVAANRLPARETRNAAQLLQRAYAVDAEPELRLPEIVDTAGDDDRRAADLRVQPPCCETAVEEVDRPRDALDRLIQTAHLDGSLCQRPRADQMVCRRRVRLHAEGIHPHVEVSNGAAQQARSRRVDEVVADRLDGDCGDAEV